MPQGFATVKIITVLGSKGGVGKSTLASNLLVAARLDGIAATGMDLDTQGSFAGWAGKRHEAGAEPPVRVIACNLIAWRDALEDAGEGIGIVIADTPPGLPDEDHRAAIRELALGSTLVLVPSLAEGPTLEMLGEVGAGLAELGAPLVFVLNKVDSRRRATREARAYLAEFGEVCDVEVPAREHVHQAMHGGLTVAEDMRLGGAGAMRDLWTFVADRVGLS